MVFEYVKDLFHIGIIVFASGFVLYQCAYMLRDFIRFLKG